MSGFAKVFESILESSLSLESPATRWVFLTFILLRDRHHEVRRSSFSISNRAHIPLYETEKAIACLCSPDPNSRGKDHDGRRLLPIDGGWFVVNGEYYRKLMSDEDKREKDTLRQQKKRERDSHALSHSVTPRPSCHVLSEMSQIPDPRSQSQIPDPRERAGDPPVPPSAPPPGDSELTPLWMEYQLQRGPDPRHQFDKQVNAALVAGKLSHGAISRFIASHPGCKAWDIYDALVPKPEKATPKEKPVRSFEQIASDAEKPRPLRASSTPGSVERTTHYPTCPICRGSGHSTERRPIDPSSPYWRKDKPYVEIVVPCPYCPTGPLPKPKETM